MEIADKIETLEKQVQSLRSDLYETLLEIKASLPGASDEPQSERPGDAATPPTKQPRKRRAKRTKTASKGQKTRSVADGASTSTKKRSSDEEAERPAPPSESSQFEVKDDQGTAVAGDASRADRERLEALLEVYASAGILPYAAKDALYHIVTLNEASPPIDGGLSLWDCASVMPELNDAMIRGRKASEILGDVLPGNS